MFKEYIRTVNAEKRFKSLLEWVSEVLAQPVELTRFSGGNSSKRYYRITNPDVGLIVMDMLPSIRNARFIQLHNLFRGAGIRVPEVHAHRFRKNIGSGFILLKDLGANNSYPNVLKIAPWRTYILYRNAWQLIAKLQAIPLTRIRLPSNLDIRLDRSLRKLPKWYAAHYRNRPLTMAEHIDYFKIRSLLKKSYRAQAKVMMHGDFHLGNLFDTNQGTAMVDFAGSRIGPPTYDMAQLVYNRSMRDEFRLDSVKHHWEHSVKVGLPVNMNFDEHRRQYDWILIQIILRDIYRNLRSLKKMKNIFWYEKRLLTIASRYREMLPLVKIIETRAG